MAKTYDLGAVSAYAIAVEHGYTGTEEEFAAELTGASQAAREAAEDASNAEAYAVGTRNGVEVTEEDPAYQNNAKFFAENLPVDNTLTRQGRPADAKKVGDELTAIKNEMNDCVYVYVL